MTASSPSLVAIRAFFALAVAVLTFGPISVGAAEAYAPREISKQERCPVCGMQPANYPKWHAQILFKDKAFSAFDSPADLFRFLHDMAKYDKKHSTADIGAIYVTDYARGAWLEARQAFFVQGAKVRGPMGPDLPAFGSKEGAEAFVRQAGGRVLGFDQVTPQVIENLRAR